MNLASDVVLLALPWPMVARLKVGRAQRWGLVGVFCLGGMYVSLLAFLILSIWVADGCPRVSTCIIGIVRAVVMKRVKTTDRPCESPLFAWAVRASLT